MRTRAPRYYAAGVEVQCSACHEFQGNPEDGSHLWADYHFSPGLRVPCSSCGQVLRVALPLRVATSRRASSPPRR